MKIYLKWFYGYKNFWDEVILFWLLNYLQNEYNPDEIVVEVWDIERIQNRLNKNKEYLQNWIIDKLEFVENKEISKRFRQILSFFGINKYKKYFKVFWWWEVLDESRKFPHDWWNLALLHNYSIRKWKFILVWWIWTYEKFRTKKLFKYILHRAQKIICREKISYERAVSYWWKNAISYEDFSKEIFKDSSSQSSSEWHVGVILNETKWSAPTSPQASRESSWNGRESSQGGKEYINVNKDSSLRTANGTNSQWQNTILINISPKYFNQNNIEKIKNFVWKYSSDCKKIFFPADINIDKELFIAVRKDIPDLEIYDWTKHSLKDSINLFANCIWWMWSRLHFLYPLKNFGKNFESISDSDKVKKVVVSL